MASEAQKIVSAISRHGLNGAHIKSKNRGKMGNLAKHMIKEVPGGAETILEVIEEEPLDDIWPFREQRNPSWDLFDLWEHWEKAQSIVNAEKRKPRNRDLQEYFGTKRQ